MLLDNFLLKYTSTDNLEYYDFSTFQFSGFSKFLKQRLVNTYTIKSDDLGKLDLISQKVYNTTIYWWVIAYVNNIVDPVNDLYLGQKIVLPKIEDIQNYIQIVQSQSDRVDSNEVVL